MPIGDIVEVTVFDDGNSKYQHYQNSWKVTKSMFGGGKVELTNVSSSGVKIPSISEWKTNRLRH